MDLTADDRNVVENIRRDLREKVDIYSDKRLVTAWKNFSQSTDYPDMKKFIKWIE